MINCKHKLLLIFLSSVLTKNKKIIDLKIALDTFNIQSVKTLQDIHLKIIIFEDTGIKLCGSLY